MKVTFDIIDLECAACSVKIEKAINGFDEIEECVLDFIGKKLYVTTAKDFESTDALIEFLEKIIHIFESEVHIVVAGTQPKDKEKKKFNFFRSTAFELTKIGIGIVTIIVFMVVNANFWVELGVSLAVYLLVSYKVLIKTVQKVLHGNFMDENFLMTFATIGALALCEFGEAIGVMVLYTIGEMFQEYAVSKSKRNITQLLSLKPDKANILRNGEEHTVRPEKLQVGDIIVVKRGERVPVDGTIVAGSTYVNTAALTGESKARTVVTGDKILAGYINDGGTITVRVTAQFSDSAVSRILELVESSSARKSQSEKFITKFARVYTPTVMALALLVAVVPLFFGGVFTEWLYRALSFLVISCPCAIVISVPLTYFGGIGVSAKNGLLIKGANYLETLTKVDTVVVDKTGTLTKGVFEVQTIKNIDCDKDYFIKFLCYAECNSNHPIARSIMKLYTGKIFQSKIFEYNEIAGKGIKAVIEGKSVLCGSHTLMTDNNVECEDVASAGTVVHLSVNDKYLGYVVIADAIKDNVVSDIAQLRKLGIKHIIMLTGDNKDVADQVCKDLGIDQCYANLMPEDKTSILTEIINKAEGKVVYVGDGINDAPVLTLSDVGFAMGKFGSDVAIEAGDVVLLNDNLSSVGTAIKIARRTRVTSIINIVFALGVKIAIMVMGVCGISSLWWAVIGDVGVSILAILNAMTMLLYKPNKNKKTR